MATLSASQIEMINKIGYTSIEAPAEDETIAAELPSATSGTVRLTGVVTKKDGIQTRVTRDDNGESVRVDRYEAHRARLGKRIEFQIGTSRDRIKGEAIEVTDAPELPVVNDDSEIEEIAEVASVPFATRYEGVVISASPSLTLIRSKSFGFTIRADEGECLSKFLINGDKVSFEQNWDWFHNPRARNLKRVADIEPEPVPAPSMHASLIAAKDEHIARLEARIAELEAQVKKLKKTLDLESGYAEFLESK